MLKKRHDHGKTVGSGNDEHPLWFRRAIDIDEIVNIFATQHPRLGVQVLPYTDYMGTMCRSEGYGFHAVYSGILYINQRVWVKDRVLFSRKLIIWLKILV